MTVILYIVAAAFMLMAFALLFTYHRTRHHGVLLMGLAYGGAAVAGVALSRWWPLLAGFALVWLLKLAGFDPGPGRPPTPGDGR